MEISYTYSDQKPIVPQNNQDTEAAIVKDENPIAETSPYYRSRLYTTDSGKNPLIASASAIFTLISKFQGVDYQGEAKQLHEFLVHEIRAFESKSKDSGYAAETILAARYILCATLDDIILTTALGENNTWESFKLLHSFQNTEDKGERFFTILDRISEHSQTYIDLLELIYLSLSYGYKGQFRRSYNGEQRLNEIIDELFHTIREVRRDPSTQLSKHNKIIKNIVHPIFRKLTPKRLIITSCSLSLAMFILFNVLITLSKAPVAQALNNIQHSYVEMTGDI